MRTRAALYGAAAALVLAGVLSAIFVAGRTGETLSIAGGALGGIGLLSLLFLEVGLAEDRERDASGGQSPVARPRLRRPPRRRG